MVEETEEEGEKEKDEKESKVTVNDKWTIFIVF